MRRPPTSAARPALGATLAIALAACSAAPAPAPFAAPRRALAHSAVNARSGAPPGPSGASSSPGSASAGASSLPIAPPAELGFDAAKLALVDDAVKGAIARGEVAGAVVLVARGGRIAYRKAFGLRAVVPASAPMTVDTVFDLASLTKPLATAMAIGVLLDRGTIGLDDPVAKWLPAFAAHDKAAITIRALLLHTSGLPADDPLSEFNGAPEEVERRLLEQSLARRPGTAFEYSDVGYMVLGKLVESVSREPLDVFARDAVYEPLGLHDTGFRPSAELARRAAPTTTRDGRMLQGEVHDPRAARLGGVAGHAGLFSTADDVAVLATALLEGGAAGDRRIFSEAIARTLTTPRAVPGGLRALGWDVDTKLSGNRGDRFPIGGFGHTGFTGTSLWCDVASDTVVVVLTSRLHPDGKGDARPLRRRVATLVADAIVGPPAPRDPPAPRVLTGLDVLEREGFARLRNARIGLVTHRAARDREGRTALDVLRTAPGVTLAALFAPEHGLDAAEDRPLDDARDAATGLVVHSLHGAHRRPSPRDFDGLDAVVVDLVDAGTRFFTYETTLAYVLEAAAARGVRVVVLDRPDPLGGDAVEGPVLERGRESFTGAFPLPVRHGLTMGELARMIAGEERLHVALDVVPAEGWRRRERLDATGIRWVPPSPNLRTLDAALLYPGVGLLETTNVSVGRGTDHPFARVGAPWIDGVRLAAEVNRAAIAGARSSAARFTPQSSTFAGYECAGVAIEVTDPDALRPVALGLSIASVLQRLYGRQWRGERMLTLLANRPALDRLLAGASPDEVEAAGDAARAAYLRRRGPYLLYP